MMRARGLETGAVVRRQAFELHLYKKRRIEQQNLVEFDNGEFIAAVGTLVYRGQIGPLALTSLFESFHSGRFRFEDATGQFAAWIYFDGRLHLFNDYRGMQHVYHDAGFALVSTSFLAMQAATRFCTPNIQEVYEYLTLTWYYGNKSLLEGIDRLDRRYIHHLLPVRSDQPKQIDVQRVDDCADFDTQVEFTHGVLRQYFERLVDLFGDRISLGLTSGYDSRMILAYLRLCGCLPSLYVQGPDDATDVRIAKAVAGAAGIPIDHDPAAALPEFAREQFIHQLQASALYLDGVHHAGLFQDWALIADARGRLERPELLRLYGMAGEMFRRTIPLPERTVSISTFVRAWSDKADTSSYRAPFDRTRFRRRIGDKLVEVMELAERRIEPAQTQLVWPHFKSPANSGWQMSAQNERAFALCPYADPLISLPSVGLRIPFRRYGRLQSALITRADPVIAAVPSSYGHAFSEQPPSRTRWRARILRSVPVASRRYLYALKAQRMPRKALPFYLADDYLQVVFPDGCPNVGQLIDLEAERDPGVLSRAYTLELLLSGRFLDFT